MPTNARPKLHVVLTAVAGALAAGGYATAAPAGVGGELRTWHAITLDILGPSAAEAAATFRDYRFDVVFRNEASGREYHVPGFFAADGRAADTGAGSGNVWRAYFNPPSAGAWTYVTAFRQGTAVAASLTPTAGQPVAGADGLTGSFTVAPTDKAGDDFRAKGMLAYAGEHYLRHAGTDEYFIKSGAGSPENFLAYADFDNTVKSHAYAAHLQDWREGDPTWAGGKGKGIIGAVNYLGSEGVNSLYFLTMNVNGDGDDVWPWTSPSARSVYDVSKLEQWGKVFEHMGHRGISLHIVTQETENDQLLDGGELGVERKIYYRELVARFGHANGLVWNLGEENTNTDAQRKTFASFVKALDPYDHPVVVHTVPSGSSAEEVFNPLLGFADFDGPSLQTGDPRAAVRKWVTASESAGHPWVATWDEQIPADSGVLPDGLAGSAANHDDTRAALWGSLAAGGAGLDVYFGYSYPHNDLTLEDFRSRDSVWDWMSAASKFFERLPLVEMAPLDGATTNATGDFVFAEPGQIYVSYSKVGQPISLDLRGYPGTYAVVWSNPRTGQDVGGAVSSVTGGAVVSLGSPPVDDGKDWVVQAALAVADPAPPSGTAVTLVASASVLDGTGGAQSWTEGVNLTASGWDGAAAVVTHSADGFGVRGGRFADQLDHDPATGGSEVFGIAFARPVTDAVLRLGRLYPTEGEGKGESGAWVAYDAAGGQVAGGSLDATVGVQVGPSTYDLPLATDRAFSRLEIRATGYGGGSAGSATDSSDFALQQLSYVP